MPNPNFVKPKIIFIVLFSMFLCCELMTYVMRAAQREERASRLQRLERSYYLTLPYLKEILLGIVMVFFIVIKLATNFCSKVQFVPFNVSLNLLRNEVPKSRTDMLYLVLYLLTILYFLILNPNLYLHLHYLSSFDLRFNVFLMMCRYSTILQKIFFISIFFLYKNTKRRLHIR